MDRPPPSAVPTTAAAGGLRVAAFTALATNIMIVLTGGIVRLTSSGLGCPDWPRCSGASVIPPAGGEPGWHQYVEFGNRLLTFVVLAAVVAAWVLARRSARPETVGPARTLVLGVLGQALLGGITVLTGLHPLIVAAHFLVSAALIATAMLLVFRVEGRGRDVVAHHARLARPALVLGGLAAAVLVLGTLVTAAGPHAGDPGTVRLGLSITAIARSHSASVWLTVATTVLLLVRSRSLGARDVQLAAALLLTVEVIQGAVGYAQYALGIPAALVAVHLLLACFFTAATTWLVLTARARPGATA